MRNLEFNEKNMFMWYIVPWNTTKELCNVTLDFYSHMVKAQSIDTSQAFSCESKYCFCHVDPTTRGYHIWINFLFFEDCQRSLPYVASKVWVLVWGKPTRVKSKELARCWPLLAMIMHMYVYMLVKLKVVVAQSTKNIIICEHPNTFMWTILQQQQQ